MIVIINIICFLDSLDLIGNIIVWYWLVVMVSKVLMDIDSDKGSIM